jgi:hypothetical protein
MRGSQWPHPVPRNFIPCISWCLLVLDLRFPGDQICSCFFQLHPRSILWPSLYWAMGDQCFFFSPVASSLVCSLFFSIFLATTSLLNLSTMRMACLKTWISNNAFAGRTFTVTHLFYEICSHLIKFERGK